MQVGNKELTSAIGGLSIASAVALVLVPRTMGRVYGMPFRPLVLRTMGLRDLLIGTFMLSRHQRLGSAFRAAADIADAALIFTAGSRAARTHTVLPRLAIAAASALTATYLARS